jgi:hypothetical protein
MALQNSIHRLIHACEARGWTIDEFLALPASDIVAIAGALRIPASDLRGICEWMLQELDAISVERLH